MISHLKHKAVSATIWSTIDTFARQGGQFGITLILARLLTPTDYGTVGLLSIFFGVAAVFIGAGFPSALIQRQEISNVDLSSVFFFNICIALLFSLLLCAAASWIASFYNMPVLTPLTRLMAVSLFIGAFGSIQSILLIKSLNFRRQCIISLATVVVSGSIAVVLAWRNYGVWSLAISTVAGTCVTTILLWLLSPWRPRFVFSVTAVRSLFKFGGFLLISGLLDTMYTRLNTLVIGKFYSPQDLGYYSRADGTQQLPAGLLANIISRVAFPIFSAAQNDKQLLRAGLLKAITMVMMLNIPIMLGTAVTARLLVLVLFGEKWLPCVQYLQILCLGGIFWPLHVINLNILTAQGHSKLFFRIEVIKKVIGILILGSACFFGIYAIAWSSVVTSVICFVINAHYSGLFLNYGAVQQTVDLLPYLAVSLVMVVCVWGASMLPLQAPLLQLIARVLTGVATYSLVCISFRLPAFMESIQLVAPRLRALNLFGLIS